MAGIEPAVPDFNWLEPEELYFALGEQCEIDRPLFQGDVFTNVPLPIFPRTPPAEGRCEVEFVGQMVMVVPHPCQCYHGDKLRASLTVAPVSEVLNYENFGTDRTGKKDAFALPDLLARSEGDENEGVSFVANFGKVVSVPSAYLAQNNRIACLSHMGMGLLSKRFIQFQSRVPCRLGEVMAFTQDQWNEAFLMQAWVRENGKLRGFSRWMREEIVIPSISDSKAVIPAHYLTSALPELLDEISKD
ncbi:hypothetical protein [Streptomyces globisporus]